MRLIAFMNSYTEGISGGDTCFIEIAKRMKGYDKVVITSLLGKEACETAGLKAGYLITSRELRPKNVILTYFNRILVALLLGIKINKGDILYSTSDFLPDVIPAFYKKIRNPDAVWIQKMFHLIPSDRFLSYYTQRISFFFIKRFADLVIVDNSLLKKDLIKLKFNDRKVALNRLGIDLGYLNTVKAKDKKRYDGVFLARLHPSKGIFDLVEIWRLICQINPRAKLEIIGMGDEKILKKLNEEVAKNNLNNNIDILGYLERGNAVRKIKESKVFVHPSHEEGFGVAPLEAQACGLPVVAWNLPVYKEVFPKGMIKVEIEDMKKFAGEVLNLLNNKKLYVEVSKEAIDNAARYDWDEVAKRELGLIEKVAKFKK